MHWSCWDCFADNRYPGSGCHLDFARASQGAFALLAEVAIAAGRWRQGSWRAAAAVAGSGIGLGDGVAAAAAVGCAGVGAGAGCGEGGGGSSACGVKLATRLLDSAGRVVY